MQVLKSIKVLFSIKTSQDYILVTNGLHILGVLVGFKDFGTHFLDEALF
jgi:hypothetical protein